MSIVVNATGKHFTMQQDEAWELCVGGIGKKKSSLWYQIEQRQNIMGGKLKIHIDYLPSFYDEMGTKCELRVEWDNMLFKKIKLQKQERHL